MYKKGKAIIGVVIFSMNIISGFVSGEDLRFKGEVVITSSYYWRGVQQFEGNALQGTSRVDYGIISLGMWYSSVIFGDGTVMETDPFLSLNLPTGCWSSSVGLTVYSYDLKKYNEYADWEIEINGSIGYDCLSFSGYYVPQQTSTKNDPSSSNYWFEFSGGIATLGINWGITWGYGTYTSRYLKTPKEGAISTLTLSVIRSITDYLSVNWNYIIQTEKELHNGLYINCTLTF